MNKKFLRNFTALACIFNFMCSSAGAMESLINYLVPKEDAEYLLENYGGFGISDIRSSEPTIVYHPKPGFPVVWHRGNGPALKLSAKYIKEFNSIKNESDRSKALAGLLGATKLSGMERFSKLFNYFALSSPQTRLSFISEAIDQISKYNCRISKKDLCELFRYVDFSKWEGKNSSYKSYLSCDDVCYFRFVFDADAEKLMNSKEALHVFFSANQSSINIYFSGCHLEEEEYERAPLIMSLSLDKINQQKVDNKKEVNIDKINEKEDKASKDDTFDNININKVILEKAKERDNKLHEILKKLSEEKDENEIIDENGIIEGETIEGNENKNEIIEENENETTKGNENENETIKRKTKKGKNNKKKRNRKKK